MINSKEKSKNYENDNEDSDSDSGDYLNFIKINGKNKIEEVNGEEHIQQLITFSKTLTIENEDNIGQEMNKFFNLILNENKEGEALKVNIAISNRFYKDKSINKYINLILNKKENTNLVLTEELSENISIILTNAYQKIKNNNKIANFDELVEKINNYNFSEEDILKKYLINRDIQNSEEFFSPQKSSEYIINISRYTTADPYKKNFDKIDIKNRITVAKSPNKNKYNKRMINNNYNDKNDDILYEYKEFKNDKFSELPPEMLILRRKFQKVKKLKLIITSHTRNRSNYNVFSSNSYNSDENNINASYNNSNYNDNNINEGILQKKDVDNNIFVLLNLNWLFPQLIEIEIDLSNDNLIKDQIKLYKHELKIFSKVIKREIKRTNYPLEETKEKINFDPLRGSIFPNYFQLQEEIHNDNSNSYSLKINEFSEEDNNSDKNIIDNAENNNIANNNIENNNIIIDENNNKIGNNNLANNFDNFIKKYEYAFQMIIIYGFFISKIPKLFFCNFTIPFNLEREIIRMLQIHEIYFSDFNFLSFLSDVKMIRITIDFNSLDNRAFGEVLSLLVKNNNLLICQLNFFPSENNFETEILYKLLQDNNPNYKSISFNKINKKIMKEIEPYEDIDNFLLRKLSDYFEININKLFQTICIKSTVTELSLIFNIPSLINKIEYYLIIILKLIMNLFIVIDNSKLNLSSFILQVDNFSFDSKKYPYLIEFLNKIYIFSNKELKLSKLTCQMKFLNITNIYRIIPYNINELSIGEFDCLSFMCFIDYITSSEFSVHSKLNKLKINLINTIFFIDDIFDYFLKLFSEFPKNLKEISIDTELSITLEQLNKLLNITNYNTIENIFMTFSKKSLNDKGYDGKINNEIFYMSKDKVLNDENYIDLFFIKRNIKTIRNIKTNIMINIGLKYNRKFMDYNIFKNLEKFLCKNCKKKYIIQFK